MSTLAVWRARHRRESSDNLADTALFRRWVATVTAGELLGFGVPASAGALLVTSTGLPPLPVLVVAGAAEGAILGWAQTRVLRQVLVGLSSTRWVALTVVATAAAWLLGMLPSTLRDVWSAWPPLAAAAAGTALVAVLLGSLGVAQWFELRRHLPRAHRWVTGNAVAWLLGLAAFFAVTSPLWRPGQQPSVVAAIGVLGGLVMAFIMATVTGLTLVRLVDHGRHSAGVQGQHLLVNPLTELLLRSRLHRLVSGSTALLTYRGLRTGKPHTLPVRYAQRGDEVVVVAGWHSHKLWWRNFAEESTVSLLLRGTERSATARRVLLFDDGYETMLASYRRRYPRVRLAFGVPVIRLRLEPHLTATPTGD